MKNYCDLTAEEQEQLDLQFDQLKKKTFAGRKEISGLELSALRQQFLTANRVVLNSPSPTE
jgi:hypothetical protein